MDKIKEEHGIPEESQLFREVARKIFVQFGNCFLEPFTSIRSDDLKSISSRINTIGMRGLCEERRDISCRWRMNT